MPKVLTLGQKKQQDFRQPLQTDRESINLQIGALHWCFEPSRVLQPQPHDYTRFKPKTFFLVVVYVHFVCVQKEVYSAT